MTKLNMVKALNVALQQEMERDPDVLILGEDVGVDGILLARAADGRLVRVVSGAAAEEGTVHAAGH